MIFDVTTFVGFHTVLSLVALGFGIVATLALIGGSAPPALALAFLVTMIGTSATGFGFPFVQFLPSHAVAIVSLVVLLAVVLARYQFAYVGAWRWIYAAGVVLATYLDAFVLVVQLFQKVPALKAMAPTGSEPPFAIVQGIVLIVFIGLGIAAVRKFHPASAAFTATSS